VIVVTFFEMARQLFQRHRQMKALRRAERLHLNGLEFHGYQASLGGWPNPHRILMAFDGASLHRVRDEQLMLKRRKDFWQLYDIDETARYMRDLERRCSPELSVEWESIPLSAIPALHQRIVEMGREERRMRDEAYLTAAAIFRPNAFWWLQSDQAPAIGLDR